VIPVHHIIRSPDGDGFYAFNTHLNVYRLGDASPTLCKDSKAVYSAVEWNDVGSTACTLASIDTRDTYIFQLAIAQKSHHRP